MKRATLSLRTGVVAGGLFFALLVVTPFPAAAQTWTQKFPATNPPFGIFPAMAYDSARQQVVLFGGFDLGSFTNSNETWVWDGVTWTEKFPATSPPARGSHAIAYDAARQQVVIFGGAVDGTILGDTWVWDGTNWTQKFPATSPSPRLHSAMAYDVAHQQVVLFGGGPGSPTAFADTWVWDGTNWTQKFPATSPPARSGHGLAYDAARGEVVLFAAWTGIIFFNDTWTWDGNTWTQKFPATSPPIPRFHYRVAYDAARGEVVLFGGQGPSDIYDDTWIWDGVAWTQSFPATSPPGRAQHAMAYDAARSQVVMFGGNRGGSFQATDTWVWGAVEVAIDIKPGSDPNAINPRARGVIPVAILTTASFDARTVSPSTVRFGPAGASIALPARLEDVDADGDLDLVLHFRTQETGIACGDTQASLTGETFDGQQIRGSNSIVTVACK